MTVTVKTRVDEYGQIRATSRVIWTGRNYEQLYADWQWHGPPVAKVSTKLCEDGRAKRGKRQPGDRLVLGPYTVSVVEYDWMCDAYLVRRVDEHSFAGWLMARRIQGKAWLSRMAERVVLTLAVWGLAEWPPDGVRPSFAEVRRKWSQALDE
jgi:hypothetical protein